MSARTKNNRNNIETATLGAGCFWSSEAIFQQINGVIQVTPGYCGGFVPHPTYFQVCQSNTGHTEVCQIKYDPEVISFDELLEIFWLIHNPTSLNFQDYDIGPQYRSVIFYHNKEQELISREYRTMLNDSGEYPGPIITEIRPVTKFYKAEICNINYYYLNAQTPYSLYVIAPKIKTFRNVFKDKLKTSVVYN